MDKKRPIGGTRATIPRLERSPVHRNPAAAPAPPARRAARILLFVLLALPVLGLMASNPPPFLFLNVSKSASLGFWIREPGLFPLRRGSFYALCLPVPVATVALSKRYLIYIEKSPCPGHVPMVLKRIVALPGDRIDLSEAGLRIDGSAPIPGTEVRSADSSGRRLSHMPYGSRTLGNGEIFLLGENLGISWDSRYYGPVPESALRFPVRTFFVWR